jgi:hypothetical protein
VGHRLTLEASRARLEFQSAAEQGVAADRRPVVANFEENFITHMATYPRHAARNPRSPALPAGRAPLSRRWAPAAERRVVRPPVFPVCQ